MRETLLFNHVNENHTDKATNSRMSRARKIEKIMQCSLETIVASEDKMEETLARLAKENNSGVLINALHHYYEAEHGKKYDRYNNPAAGAAYIRSLLAGNLEKGANDD